ncbi:MAG: C4-type zinc ribbon domain-containing protein [Endomicrobium sp.]|jgi:predicted  nucleic acid-binding Zn-ribbon protein|nr:C4-type zinc ribbon domain-containing protein [Endomicrobium sp.]
MENLKQDLELLYNLQEYDIKIAALRNHIAGVPGIIAARQKEIEDRKADTEAKKKNFVDLSSLKKEKEAVLDAKEKAVAKNSAELNSIKSNDVYKAMLLEIEKAKADKSAVEDEILELMVKMDAEAPVVKNAENELREFEQKMKSEISEIENSAKKDEESIADIEKKREEYKHKVNQKILDQYERIREGRDGQGIVLIDGESCGGCGMVLRPQLINQAQKCHDLVFCDNCSRILLKK